MFAAAPADAQTYPSRPVTWVLPFGTGGVVDSSARVIAKALSNELGQTVIIDNKPGAAGIVGTEAVATAKPDGYTMLYGTSGPLATFTSLYKKLSYSPQRSFVPVHAIGETPLILVANANRPYKSVQDLIAYARQNPDKLNYGSSGTGNSTHLAGELLQKTAQIKLTHVPYKSAANEVADLLSGVIDIVFDAPIVMKGHIAAGTLQPLAVTGSQRLKNLPQVPTMAEAGLPTMQITAWSAAMVPAGTPEPIVKRLSDAFHKALRDPSVVKYFEENDSRALSDIDSSKLAAFIESETIKFKELVEISGATVE